MLLAPPRDRIGDISKIVMFRGLFEMKMIRVCLAMRAVALTSTVNVFLSAEGRPYNFRDQEFVCHAYTLSLP